MKIQYFFVFLVLVVLIAWYLVSEPSLKPTIPYKVYCISHDNQERKTRMTKRFETLHIPYDFPQTRESCMLSHREALQHFLDDDSVEYGIICEDDIYLKLSFVRDIQKLLYFMETHPSLDLLLVGYLLHPSIDIVTNPEFTLKYPIGSKACYPYTLYAYSINLWGTQMYIVSKTAAHDILQLTAEPRCKYKNVPFAADWTITKFPNCVLAYPPIAVEEGNIKMPAPQSQIIFHKECSERYDPKLYI